LCHLKQHITLPEALRIKYILSSECWEAEFREVHKIPINSLSLFSKSLPIVDLFGARRLSH
jgi:hypothetical protein